jgi:hypothetical protein
MIETTPKDQQERQLTPTISIRPVTITGQTFNDGVSVFTVTTAAPIAAWAIFIDHAEGTMSGLAPDRQTALEAARQMAAENGWRLTHVAAEEAQTGAEGARTLQ